MFVKSDHHWRYVVHVNRNPMLLLFIEHNGITLKPSPRRNERHKRACGPWCASSFTRAIVFDDVCTQLIREVLMVVWNRACRMMSSMTVSWCPSLLHVQVLRRLLAAICRPVSEQLATSLIPTSVSILLAVPTVRGLSPVYLVNISTSVSIITYTRCHNRANRVGHSSYRITM